MTKRPAVRLAILLVCASVAGSLVWNSQASAQADQTAKGKSKSQTASQTIPGDKDKAKAQTQKTGEKKSAGPAVKTNSRSLWINIDSHCVSNAYDTVHAPKKSEGGLVVFSADGDFTIEFQYADFWKGSPNQVPVSSKVGAALFVDSEGGKYTHFCMHGPGCAPCPATWPPARTPGHKGVGSDPNDIVVP